VNADVFRGAIARASDVFKSFLPKEDYSQQLVRQAVPAAAASFMDYVLGRQTGYVPDPIFSRMGGFSLTPAKAESAAALPIAKPAQMSQPTQPQQQNLNVQRPASSGTVDASSPQAFIQTFSPVAEYVEQRYGVPKELTLAVAANETGWGKSAPGNVYFGIKALPGQQSQSFNTWEVAGGQPYNTAANFATYQSPYDAAEAFAQLITTAPRYAQAKALFPTRDVTAIGNALQQGGYATDPTWGQKLGSIAQTFTPTQTQAGSEQAVSIGRKYLGRPYEFGASSKSTTTFDCSSFVQRVFAEQGVKLNRTTDTQYSQTFPISQNEARPGDLIFYSGKDPDQPGVQFPHVAIYAGNGQVLDARERGGVAYRPMHIPGYVPIFRRVR
jgi:flagellum-specific peptidoglycan hydrolase FlgJ